MHKIYVNADRDKGESGGPLYYATVYDFVAGGILSLPADRCPEVFIASLRKPCTKCSVTSNDMKYRLRASYNDCVFAYGWRQLGWQTG